MPRLGMNEIEVILRKRNPEVTEDLILNDVEIIIEQKKREGAHLIRRALCSITD